MLPATSANLGPAFDAAALAFGLFLKIRATPADEFSITAQGRDADICGRVENHLILTTYREVLQDAGKPVRPLALVIDNQIPIGKGCGSSAAARLAGSRWLSTLASCAGRTVESSAKPRGGNIIPITRRPAGWVDWR